MTECLAQLSKNDHLVPSPFSQGLTEAGSLGYRQKVCCSGKPIPVFTFFAVSASVPSWSVNEEGSLLLRYRFGLG